MEAIWLKVTSAKKMTKRSKKDTSEPKNSTSDRPMAPVTAVIPRGKKRTNKRRCGPGPDLAKRLSTSGASRRVQHAGQQRGELIRSHLETTRLCVAATAHAARKGNAIEIALSAQSRFDNPALARTPHERKCSALR